MKYSFAPHKRKMPKAVKAIIIIAAVLLAALYVLGMTLGSASDKRAEISQAVEENRTLRGELAAKDERINELEAEVRRLNDVIASIPTPSPEPYVPEDEPVEEYGDEELSSPRDYDDWDFKVLE